MATPMVEDIQDEQGLSTAEDQAVPAAFSMMEKKTIGHHLNVLALSWAGMPTKWHWLLSQLAA